MSYPIELDGSFGEGGGQILRSSLALALLTGKAFHLRNVRAGRAKPGLQPQHLMSVRAAATIGQAELRGASRDSTDLTFVPGPVTAGKYIFAIGTAGATGLQLLHTLLPAWPCVLAATLQRHHLHHRWHSRQNQSLLSLPRPDLATLVCNASRPALAIWTLKQPGFYPRERRRHCWRKSEQCLCACYRGCSSTRWPRLQKSPASVSSPGYRKTSPNVRRGKRSSACAMLNWRWTFAGRAWKGGPGTMLALVLETQPVPTLFFALGERGKRAEKVADEAVEQVKAHLAAEPPGVDVHSADRLAASAGTGGGSVAFPGRTRDAALLTNLAVIRRFLDRDLVCEGAHEGQPGWVRII